MKTSLLIFISLKVLPIQNEFPSNIFGELWMCSIYPPYLLFSSVCDSISAYRGSSPRVATDYNFTLSFSQTVLNQIKYF